ncbi:MAG: hypothetical protein ACJAYC_000499 [Halieaceae bacterium]|jgi:hypothetical protein
MLLAALVVACSTGPRVAPEPDVITGSAAWPSPVGRVNLKISQYSSTMPLLDVGVAIFDPGIPEDASTHSKLAIFPEIREAEAKYMPALLRDALVDANGWGPVRVLPEPNDTTVLLITGRIEYSDGLRLALQVRAVDATGRVWLDKMYLDESLESDYPVPVGGDPYQDIYFQIANDLLAARDTLAIESLRHIPVIAELRYAESLSPEVFAGYLSRDEQGLLTANRLPADGDPMMSRVQRILNQEYLFIDTVDEQYLKLSQEMGPTYDLWRQYGREQAIYKEDYQRRLSTRESQGRRGTFPAMQQTYNAFKWTKIQQQDLYELAVGFDNEVAPTVLEASGKVFRLNGTLETQYSEWRDILREIFALETGLPAR